MKGTIETMEERVVYENDYATVYDDRVRFPDGHEGTYFRWQWNAPHGVAIVPVIEDRVVLIRAYRYQNKAFVVEIPQGFGGQEGGPEEDARRELREETGLEAGELVPLMQFEGNIATHCYLAKIAGGQSRHMEGAESTESIVETIELPISELTPAKLNAMGVVGPVTMAALLAVRLVSER
ncbi:NUDIX domain-containing protein [Alteriqipengyuania lutimaris]|uniref:NUDIX hydrolase n=1 Tax=Alteriqipengyuania lutimaris TaxID=1538146 RepID=A0A395LLU6_9SPHN|nr:NUDIX hydrolase [Alteriqipengyuania lutimaris]MBB3033217.1 ADP-ribose pyrophosphatase YjhB (NUDIX family) [Alteriqipengyuania lutimaris]RDS77735.1 NUDIX hydrolase [Alteriqipengyuania lutimaris]